MNSFPKGHIIIADDQELNRYVLKILLKDLIMLINEAGDGQAVLETLEQVYPTPVVLLLDLNMPVMDGYEVLSILRANPDKYAQVKTIIVSGTPYGQFVQHGFSEFIDAYIEKPVNQLELIEKITIAMQELTQPTC